MHRHLSLQQRLLLLLPLLLLPLLLLLRLLLLLFLLLSLLPLPAVKSAVAAATAALACPAESPQCWSKSEARDEGVVDSDEEEDDDEEGDYFRTMSSGEGVQRTNVKSTEPRRHYHLLNAR